MKFRYLRDPLFLVCCACYGVNRWLLKPNVDSQFLHSWFNDLLLVPCAIPVVLWLFRALQWREHDRAPGIFELSWIVAVWAFLFEWAGPHLFAHATGDWRDVAMYLAGALLAWSWWRMDIQRTGTKDARPPIMEAGAA